MFNFTLLVMFVYIKNLLSTNANYNGQRIILYPYISIEKDFPCSDSYVFALNTIIKNYSSIKNEIFTKCKLFVIYLNPNLRNFEHFFNFHIKLTIEKINKNTKYKIKILEKYKKKEKNLSFMQKLFVLHFFTISYEMIFFWTTLLFNKHYISNEVLFYDIIENFINNEELNNNKIFENLYIRFGYFFQNGLLASEKINYLNILEYEIISFYCDIISKISVDSENFKTLIPYDKIVSKDIEKEYIPNQHQSILMKNIPENTIYEIRFKLNDMHYWLHYLKLTMIESIKNDSLVKFYNLKFNVFNYDQILAKIKLVNHLDFCNEKNFYFSSYYIIKRFFKIIDYRSCLIYADDILNQIISLLKINNIESLPIKIIVDLDTYFIRNLGTSIDNTTDLEGRNMVCYSNQKNNIYWLAFDLHWLEAYTFITSLEKFKNYGVNLNEYELPDDKKIFFEQHESHILRLSGYKDKNKVKFVLMSALLNFTNSKYFFYLAAKENDPTENENYTKNNNLYNHRNKLKLFKELCDMYEIENTNIDINFVNNFKKYFIFNKDGYISKFLKFCIENSNCGTDENSEFFDCFFEQRI